MILSYLIIALFLFAIFHFIIDGIIAPSEHMISRQKLLEISAELKQSKKGYSVNEREVANSLFRSANNLITNMPRYTILNLSAFLQNLKENPELRKKAEEKNLLLDKHANEFLRVKRKDIVREADRVLAWNSMAWMLYVIPVVLVVTFLTGIKKLVDAAVFSGSSLRTSMDTTDDARYA